MRPLVPEESRTRTNQGTWNVLRSGGQEPSGIEIPTKPSGVTSAQGPIRLALGPNGEARLLLPIGGAESTRGIVGAPSLKIETSVYREAGVPRRFLDLTCLSASLETVFAEVAEQIQSRVEGGSGCVDAARSTIEEFRALLVRPPAVEVTVPMIAGLIGELLVLKRLLDRSADAWKCWRGPTGARHDFAMADRALEVKVTLRKGKSEITINGLEQLTEPAGGTLYLQHFEIEEATAGMLSIASLGQAVLAIASETDRVKELLAAVGCPDVEDAAWNGRSFRLENETLYQIGDGFPRLASSSFPGGTAPAGVSHVTYVADLADATTFKIDPSRARDVEDLFLP